MNLPTEPKTILRTNSNTKIFQSQKINSICDKGMQLIVRKITSTPSIVDDIDGRYSDNPSGCCGIITNFIDILAKEKAMDQLDAVHSKLILNNKSVSIDLTNFNKIINNFIEKGCGTCQHQCILLALYLLENGISSENILMVYFKNYLNSRDIYNQNHEAHYMLYIKIGNQGVYLDPLTNNKYTDFEMEKLTGKFNTPFILRGLNDKYTMHSKRFSVDKLNQFISLESKFITNQLNSY
ncbi:MAG: hypothetical protein ACK5WP_00995 [Neisseriaceae bacterium]